MIIIKLKGGLGNQLFQYSFGRLVALNRGEELKLDKDILGERGDTYRNYGLSHFNIKAEVATKEEVVKFKYPFGVFSKICRLLKGKVFKIYHVGYEPKLLKSKAKYFDGYFQSYKYLEPIKNILLKEITLKEPLSEKGKTILEKIVNTDSISVHVRRGDYVTDPKTSKILGILGLDYYKNSIDLIAKKIENPEFFVFSDDILWAKENLQANNMVFVSDPELKDYEEMFLMSKCKHNIIANSSFSFWGTWLNRNSDKIVIAPKKWFNNSIINTEDLIPSSWIKI